MTDTTITIDEKTRNALVKIKYELGYESMNEVVLSLIEISKKIETAHGGVYSPSSSNNPNISSYLNLSAEHIGVSTLPHQESREGSIPSSAKMK